jgi:hypothetical protein
VLVIPRPDDAGYASTAGQLTLSSLPIILPDIACCVKVVHCVVVVVWMASTDPLCEIVIGPQPNIKTPMRLSLVVPNAMSISHHQMMLAKMTIMPHTALPLSHTLFQSLMMRCGPLS